MSHSSYGGDVVIVRDGGDYRERDLKIARLEGAVEGYKESIEELFDAGMKNKKLAEKNAIASNLWFNTVKTLIDRGQLSREEANKVKNELKSKLPLEEQELLNYTP